MSEQGLLWKQGHLLSWSGKWHLPVSEISSGPAIAPRHQEGLSRCGAWAYTGWPSKNHQNQAATTELPVCKRCLKSAAKQASSS